MDHLPTIRTMGESVRLFEDSFKFFLDNPNGESLRDMENKREDMFITCRVCMQTTFIEYDDSDMKDTIRIAKAVKTFKKGLEDLASK
jgi:hypothetical protein